MGQTFKKQKHRMSWEPWERAQDPAATVALDTGPLHGLSPAPSRPAVCAGRRTRTAGPGSPYLSGEGARLTPQRV